MPTKLTDFQLNRIINRFTSRSPLSLVANPYQTSNRIIATDANVILFLSNSVTSKTITNEHESKEGISAAILKLEEYHITHSNFDPSTQLSLDSVSIQVIIKALKAGQSSKQTKYTKTRIAYSKRTNDLILTTIKLEDRFSEIEYDTLTKQYYRPSFVSQLRDGDFSLIVETNYLIDSLLTQYETNQFTTIEYSDFQSGHIKLVNDVSTVVISRTLE